MIGYSSYIGGTDKVTAAAIQVTLNGRIAPGKRKSVDMVRGLCERYPDKGIVIHYDYVYIISRFGMFAPWLKKAIIEECYGILTVPCPNLVGIVMHTDYPLSKDVLLGAKSVEEAYGKAIWDTAKVGGVLEAIPGRDPVADSIGEFRDMFFGMYPDYDSSPRVYIENSVHAGPSQDETSVFSVMRDIEVVDPSHRLFGVCYDTEHQYALDGTNVFSGVLEKLDGIPHIVHLNVVPKGVAPSSRKDVHDATYFDCTVHTVDYYSELAETYSDTLFIREVKDGTMEREVSLLNEKGIKIC